MPRAAGALVSFCPFARAPVFALVMGGSLRARSEEDKPTSRMREVRLLFQPCPVPGVDSERHLALIAWIFKTRYRLKT